MSRILRLNEAHFVQPSPCSYLKPKSFYLKHPPWASLSRFVHLFIRPQCDTGPIAAELNWRQLRTPRGSWRQKKNLKFENWSARSDGSQDQSTSGLVDQNTCYMPAEWQNPVFRMRCGRRLGRALYSRPGFGPWPPGRRRPFRCQGQRRRRTSHSPPSQTLSQL